MKDDEPTHCGHPMGRMKVTLPRNKPNEDIVFCGFHCANNFSNARAALKASQDEIVTTN